MKRKKEPYLQGKPSTEKLDEPSEAYVRHVRNQAEKLRCTLDSSQGEAYIKDALKEWVEVMEIELERYRKA